jgi:WD40 repeat protein
VWDTGTGAFLRALRGPEHDDGFRCLVTYQQRSDGRPRVAAGSSGGHLCIWDGDDFQVLHIVQTSDGISCGCLAVYEEPTRGRTRLVTG